MVTLSALFFVWFTAVLIGVITSGILALTSQVFHRAIPSHIFCTEYNKGRKIHMPEEERQEEEDNRIAISILPESSRASPEKKWECKTACLGSHVQQQNPTVYKIRVLPA